MCHRERWCQIAMLFFLFLLNFMETGFCYIELDVGRFTRICRRHVAEYFEIRFARLKFQLIELKMNHGMQDLFSLFHSLKCINIPMYPCAGAIFSITFSPSPKLHKRIETFKIRTRTIANNLTKLKKIISNRIESKGKFIAI